MPNKAYLILGHGNEQPGSFIVPKGHIIIISSHSGDATTMESSKYEKKILDISNQDLILDPLRNNLRDITKLVDVVTVYKEGDKCPKINHYPLAYHQSSSSHELTGKIYISGKNTIPNPYLSNVYSLTNNTKVKQEKIDNLYKPVSLNSYLSVNDLLNDVDGTYTKLKTAFALQPDKLPEIDRFLKEKNKMFEIEQQKIKELEKYIRDKLKLFFLLKK